MPEKMIEELKEQMKYDLFHYPERTRKEELKYRIKRLLRPLQTPRRDPYFWPQAFMCQALEAAKEWEILVQYYDGFCRAGMPVSQPDHVMNGYSLVYVYDKTGKAKYKRMMDSIYQYVLSYYEEYHHTLPYRRNHPTHMYVDALGMVVPFLCRYGDRFQVGEAIELGQKLLMEYLDKGMDKETGLPYHGYDLITGVKYGIIGWGRAVGWLLMAMADSVEYMKEGREKEKIVKAFQGLVKACFSYVQSTGYFGWQLETLEGPADTSATSMIAYAVAKGKNKAFLWGEGEPDELMEKIIGDTGMSVKEAMDRMERALFLSFEKGRIMDCSGECEGFSRYPQVYGSYPWSNGPGLRFLLEKRKC